MTNQAKLDYLYSMLGDESDGPDILNVYLDIARMKILNRMYPYRRDYAGIPVPERYEMMQLNIAVFLLVKRGAEGQVQHIENGIHRNWGTADVPEEMLNGVVPMAAPVR